MIRTEITLASQEKQEIVKAFLTSPIAYTKNISNTVSTIRQAIDVEHPIQLSEWNRLAPNEMRAVLIRFIEGTLMFFSFSKDAMPNAQIVMIVNDIIEKYYYFRLEDVALCFKKGRVDANYRKFYGRLDGSVFLEWFAKYDKERESVLQSHPSNNQTIPLISQGIPWEQYKEDLERRIAEGDEEAKKNLEAMESVRRRFEEDKGQLHAYRYNRKHRFDPK
jgi:hypothetical protein